MVCFSECAKRQPVPGQRSSGGRRLFLIGSPHSHSQLQFTSNGFRETTTAGPRFLRVSNVAFPAATQLLFRCFQPRYLFLRSICEAGVHIFCSVWGMTLRAGTSPRSVFKFINRRRCHLAVSLSAVTSRGLAITEGRPPVGRLHARRQVVIGVIYHMRKGLRAHRTNHSSARCWERRNARTHTDINHAQTHKLRERLLDFSQYDDTTMRYSISVQPFCGNIPAL